MRWPATMTPLTRAVAGPLVTWVSRAEAHLQYSPLVIGGGVNLGPQASGRGPPWHLEEFLHPRKLAGCPNFGWGTGLPFHV